MLCGGSGENGVAANRLFSERGSGKACLGSATVEGLTPVGGRGLFFGSRNGLNGVLPTPVTSEDSLPGATKGLNGVFPIPLVDESCIGLVKNDEGLSVEVDCVDCG